MVIGNVLEIMRRRLYHICYTSHREVFCRSYKDYCMMFNCIAQAVFKTQSNLLAYSIMSTHTHIICECFSPSDLVKRIRSSYAQMFNHRYCRRGSLGDESFFCDRLEGRCHVTTAISYVVRNPLHHEVCANPYAYPFSSVGQYFKSKLDRFSLSGDDAVGKVRSRSAIIRKQNILPDEVGVYSDSGMIKMDDVVDNVMVEGYFGSYRSFMYGLSRIDYEKWTEEQSEDNVTVTPVTIRTIEPFLSDDEVASILKQNHHWLKEKRITDIELCSIIDKTYVPRFGKSGYAQLMPKDVSVIRKQLLQAFQFRISSKQLDRCLCVLDEEGK